MNIETIAEESAYDSLVTLQPRVASIISRLLDSGFTPQNITTIIERIQKRTGKNIVVISCIELAAYHMKRTGKRFVEVPVGEPVAPGRIG